MKNAGKEAELKPLNEINDLLTNLTEGATTYILTNLPDLLRAAEETGNGEEVTLGIAQHLGDYLLASHVRLRQYQVPNQTYKEMPNGLLRNRGRNGRTT